MVLGILTSIAACPAIIGTTEAVRQGQAQNKKEQHRGQKTNLVATCTKNSSQSGQINGGLIVLKNNKVSLPLQAIHCNLAQPEPILTIHRPVALHRGPHHRRRRRPDRGRARIRMRAPPPLHRLLHAAPLPQLVLAGRRPRLNHRPRSTNPKLDLRRQRHERSEIRRQVFFLRTHHGPLELHEDRPPDDV